MNPVLVIVIIFIKLFLFFVSDLFTGGSAQQDHHDCIPVAYALS